MGRRIQIQAFLALLIGLGVLLGEVCVSGVLGRTYLRAPFPHDLDTLALQVQELALSVLLLWGLASLLGAWLLALLKPRRWALYSLCAVAPGMVEAVYGVMQLPEGMPAGYLLLSDLVRLALVPLFLALIYATFRRHSGMRVDA